MQQFNFMDILQEKADKDHLEKRNLNQPEPLFSTLDIWTTVVVLVIVCIGVGFALL